MVDQLQCYTVTQLLGCITPWLSSYLIIPFPGGQEVAFSSSCVVQLHLHMIIKILRSVSGFPGVRYNTRKVDRDAGELMKVSGFSSLQTLSHLRPQDYIHYLQAVSSGSKRIEKPQFHAVLSAKGKTYTKEELTAIGSRWMEEMDYGAQPYLIIYHKDTANNHVHLVSTRVSRNGKKINSAFEKRRAVDSLSKVLGYDYALQYRFSTRAQFYLILEQAGFLGRDVNEQQLSRQLAAYQPDMVRISELKALLWAYKDAPDPTGSLKKYYHIELVFHAAEGQAPYGYTILDHQTKQAFKGSEVLPLKYLTSPLYGEASNTLPVSRETASMITVQADYVGPVWIADDIDDEAILGRSRNRKKQARTNTR
jgi:hypothetical protein